MSALPLPAEIKVHPLSRGTRYELPPRPVGAARWVGLVPVLFGLLFAGGAVVWMILMGVFSSRGKNSGVIGTLFSLFGMPFVLAGLAIVRTGWLIIAGRTEIETGDGKLSVCERAGPFWKRTTIPLAQVRRFAVNALALQPPPGAASARLAAGPLTSLRIETDDTKSRELLRGYPFEWLRPLAEALGAECAVARRLSSPQATAPVIESVVTPPADPRLEAADTSDCFERPGGSKVRLDPLPNGLSLTVPPAGLLRGSKGMFVFGVIWCLFTSVIFAAIFIAGAKRSDSPPIVMWLVIVVFEAVGVGMLLGAVNMGRRRAVILVNDGQLKLGEQTLFGARTFRWQREELDTVQVGPSGMAVNNKPVLELQILPRQGRKAGFFSGRDLEELRWMATQLRQALRLGTAAT